MKFGILADIHFDWNNPIARTDEYFEAQIRKLRWCRETLGWDTPLIIDGDIFDTGKPQAFLSMDKSVVEVLEGTKSVAGNHDLSFHSMDYMPHTAYGAISRTIGCHMDGVTDFGDFEIHPFHFGTGIQHATPVFGKPMIAVTHEYTWQKKNPYIEGYNAQQMLTDYPEYVMILTGDNHQSFMEVREGRVLVNPGSLMRMSADQINYKPRLFIYEDGNITAVYIPIEEGVVTNNHIVLNDARTLARSDMMAYLELCQSSEEESYDFTSLLMQKMQGITNKETYAILLDVYTEINDGGAK